MLLLLAACFSLPGEKSDPGAPPAGDAAGTLPYADPSLTDDGCAGDGATTLFLSPDDSNSMVSPVLLRTRALERGWLGSAPVRTAEFFNYYTFPYPHPAPDAPTVSLALAALAGAPDRFELQIAVAAPPRTSKDREPLNLVFAIDVSGSMAGESMDRVAEVGDAVARQLREGDVVSVVTWADDQEVLLRAHDVVGPDDPAVLDAFAAVAPHGNTNLDAGLRLAYTLAEVGYAPGRVNRVILVSDGGANAGETDVDRIAAVADQGDGAGIYLVGVGTGGSSTYADDLMDALTDAGRGADVYLPDGAEVERVFGERLLELLDVAARDVEIRLDLPPGFQVERFSGEEYGTDRSDVRAQNLAPGATMVLYETLFTCAPEAIGPGSEVAVTVRWRDPLTGERRSTARKEPFAALLAREDPLLAKGRLVYAYADYLSALAQRTRAYSVAAAYNAALGTARVALPDDPEIDEMTAVIEAVR